MEKSLSRVAPLVFAGECRQLHEHLGKSMAQMEEQVDTRDSVQDSHFR